MSFGKWGDRLGKLAAKLQKNVGNARLGVWLDFAPQAMMRLLCRKGSDEICALGGRLAYNISYPIIFNIFLQDKIKRLEFYCRLSTVHQALGTEL